MTSGGGGISSAAARAKAKATAAAAARAAATPAWMSEMMGLEEETGLTCMVCHEGYQCKVRHVISVFGGRVQRRCLFGKIASAGLALLTPLGH